MTKNPFYLNIVQMSAGPTSSPFISFLFVGQNLQIHLTHDFKNLSILPLGAEDCLQSVSKGPF